jgi:hypothetical protein
MPDADLAKFASRCAINPPGQYEGPALASAASITLSHPVHKVTGTTSVTTINPPFVGFVGHVTLVTAGAVPLATGGNIASAVAGAASKIIQLYYDGATWYPDKA